MLTTEKIDKNLVVILLLYVMGVIIRYWAMSIGSGFDFESYCIVGDVVTQFKNVYAETSRYNYGPIFFLVQGFSYWLAHFFSMDIQQTYRTILVGVFTLTDLFISIWLGIRYDLKTSLIFFLNPISIIITGYHNQFDNMAILLALISCIYYNEEKDFTKKDVLFVVFLSLSLIMKHILFIFPFFLLVKRGLPLKKKIIYVFLPPMLFAFSFLPFVIGNIDALRGVLYNVFLYRSYAISPLFGKLLRIPEQFYFLFYIVLMVFMALIICGQAYEYMLMLYLISMFTFSSSMAPQYYIIPIVALCVIDNGTIRNIYFVLVGVLLTVSEFGSNILDRWYVGRIALEHRDKIAVWITFMLIIKEVIKLYIMKREAVCEK
jgi:hypothetical protein